MASLIEAMPRRERNSGDEIEMEIMMETDGE